MRAGGVFSPWLFTFPKLPAYAVSMSLFIPWWALLSSFIISSTVCHSDRKFGIINPVQDGSVQPPLQLCVTTVRFRSLGCEQKSYVNLLWFFFTSFFLSCDLECGDAGELFLPSCLRKLYSGKDDKKKVLFHTQLSCDLDLQPRLCHDKVKSLHLI